MTYVPTKISDPAAVRRLVVGLANRAHAYTFEADKPSSIRAARLALDEYAEAAHIGLSALGANVPQAPFGLVIIAQNAVLDAGRRPPATSPTALANWRTDLTDAILAQIGA